MAGPAPRWWALPALISWMAAAEPATAADRFVPGDPAFVVADLGRTAPDETLRALLELWRASPRDDRSVEALASAYIERARSAREPRFFGRAESVVARRAHERGASAGVRRLYAETLQFRHEFTSAEAILDALLREQPHDADSRLRRGSLRLTRGHFAGARADCAPLAVARGAVAAAGIACLAEAMAGSGDLERARILLGTLAGAALREPASQPAAQAYLLATRGELAERAGDWQSAVADYRRAVALAPGDDAHRAALADALVAAGRSGAGVVLDVESPGLALLVRQASLPGAPRALADRARQWLELEARRGDAIHHREAAMLELACQRPAQALAAAMRNFGTQRELADVRVLARAAVLARDAGARRLLTRWLAETGYADAVTAAILAGGADG